MPAPVSCARVAVLGGGITGLTAAWQLRAAGLAPVVFESAAQVGGAIRAWHHDGWLHELGPNSLLEGDPEVGRFIDAIGLGPRRLYASAAAKQRYICRGGRLVPMPASPGAFLATPLFSLRAKLGLAGEPFRARAAADEEESVADFVRRRLGREFLDYAVNPFVGGVYAGDPEKLSVQHAFPKLHALEQEHGSLLRGALARRNTSGGPKGRIYSFTGGLEELPRKLATALGGAIALETRVESVARETDGWAVTFSCGGISTTERFAAVVCALPADALAKINWAGVSHAPLLGGLRAIEQPPVVSVFTGYRREDVGHPLDGFGVLVPEVEGRLILGSLFSSTLFPGRAPDGHVALTTFVGGTRQPDLARRDDGEILRIVQAELARLVGVRAAPVCTHLQRWPRAIPQYTLGYQRFKDAIAQVEATAPGVFIGGNCRDGISLANCIASGRRLAAAAVTYAAQLPSGGVAEPPLVGAGATHD
jgi:oxygen-dependent protoporphyrinogen oxidase